MKPIHTDGIPYLENFTGTSWLWGENYPMGDLYEVEEALKSGHSIDANRLIFVHFPDGTIYEPIRLCARQYFGRPIFYHSHIYFFYVDFENYSASIYSFDTQSYHCSMVASFSLQSIPSCYNLLLQTAPLCLTSQQSEQFYMVYPDTISFPIGECESFVYRDNDIGYFSRWKEHSYMEDVVKRDLKTGEVIETIEGNLHEMPNGLYWIIK